MRTPFVTALLLWLGLTAGAFAQSPEMIKFLRAAYRVKTPDALASVLESQSDFTDSTKIWREAVIIGRTDLGEEAAGRAAIVRLMEAAVQRGGGVPDAAPLDRFGQTDLASLKAAVGFPGENELLHYLFTRSPSLRDEFQFESYAIVRIIMPDLGVNVIRERADRSYLGLTPTFSERLVQTSQDPVPVAPGERARTRRLNLAALGDLILAAKAYKAVERLQGPERAYPLVIAVDALERAARANPEDFRLVPYRAQWAALRVLRKSAPGDPFLERELSRREFAIARSAFFARQFDDAAEAYRSAPIDAGDARGQLWLSWGQAMSLFAARGEAAPMFDQVAKALTPDTPRYARMFRLLLLNLDPDERAKMSAAAKWQARIDALIGTVPIADDEWVASNQDFLRILETIGRPDIAARYLIDEIRDVDRKGRNVLRERQMLLWLAPFVEDLCDLISFEMSPSSGWQLRKVEGYNRYYDFLHSINDSGALVTPGKIVLALDEPGPYGATSPEEDCATTLAVYGIAESDLFGLAERTPPSEAATIVAGIEGWVRDALDRADPAPSAIPYLKLIWIEWFSQTFQALTVPGHAVDQFHYNPLQASELTSREAVKVLLENPAVHMHERELLKLFLATRDFLEERYP